MGKRLATLLLLVPLLPQALFEFLSDRTGRALIRIVTAGRVRTKSCAELDIKPFHGWWRDEKGLVLSEGLAMTIGVLFWLAVVVLGAASIEAWSATLLKQQ